MLVARRRQGVVELVRQLIILKRRPCKLAAIAVLGRSVACLVHHEGPVGIPEIVKGVEGKAQRVERVEGAGGIRIARLAPQRHVMAEHGDAVGRDLDVQLDAVRARVIGALNSGKAVFGEAGLGMVSAMGDHETEVRKILIADALNGLALHRLGHEDRVEMHHMSVLDERAWRQAVDGGAFVSVAAVSRRDGGVRPHHRHGADGPRQRETANGARPARA